MKFIPPPSCDNIYAPYARVRVFVSQGIDYQRDYSPCRKCRSPNKKAVSLVFSQNLPPYFQISRAFIFFFCSLPFRITPKILKFLQISWKTPFHLQIPAFPNNSICLPTKNLSSIKRTKYALYEIRFPAGNRFQSRILKNLPGVQRYYTRRNKRRYWLVASPSSDFYRYLHEERSSPRDSTRYKKFHKPFSAVYRPIPIEKQNDSPREIPRFEITDIYI